MWSLDHLSISVPSKGRYKTTSSSPSVIKSFIQIPRQGQETHTKNKKTIVVGDNKILTREIHTHMKPWVDIIRENAICIGGHKDRVSDCLCHMLYCIETSTPYNLAFFILKKMEKTRHKPKELLPYGMFLTILFKHIVSISPELAFDHYLSHNRAMHLLAPHYERKTLADQGKKRPRESNASSSSTTQNHPSSSLPLEAIVDENDDESFHSNSSSSPSQNVSSLYMPCAVLERNAPRLNLWPKVNPVMHRLCKANVVLQDETAMKIMGVLERKYKTEDAVQKRKIVGLARFLDYKMVDSKGFGGALLKVTSGIRKTQKGRNDKKGKGSLEYRASKLGFVKQEVSRGLAKNVDQPASPVLLLPRCRAGESISSANMVDDECGWWIDTGATRHVCADKSMFHSFRAVDNGQKLYMGNSATADIKGEGDVILKMTSEKELKLTNVLYVRKIRHESWFWLAV
ncbi:hypothetical protein Tco_1111828 [Tanacetum coccineum]|uniref:Retrovirus-related Pol polyprotein from transposon TNT 1-94-like beta-barrel domain-containing protein n=1 Tax=Tanacetum coccineum TaxID=301880 RepID=A0ABQ5IP80_9ASTR